MTTLLRKPIESLDVEREVSQDYMDFVLKCKSELGHKLPSIQYSSDEKEFNRKIRAIFDALKFAPLDPASVEKYQKKMARKARWRFPIIWAAITIPIGAFIVLTTIGINGVIASLATILSGAFCIGSNLIILARAAESRWRWDEYNLNNIVDVLSGSVPRFVLATALEFKAEAAKHNLECEFRIEVLEKELPLPDPFLFVNISNKRHGYNEPLSQKFYLEVWNEPGFDVLRTV